MNAKRPFPHQLPPKPQPIQPRQIADAFRQRGRQIRRVIVHPVGDGLVVYTQQTADFPQREPLQPQLQRLQAHFFIVARLFGGRGVAAVAVGAFQPLTACGGESSFVLMGGLVTLWAIINN